MSTASAQAPDFVQTPQPDGAELAAKLVSLFSFSVLSVLFGVKTFNVQFRYLTYSRWLVLALYVLSWSFTVISMLLVTTNNANFTSCFLSIMVCDVFYSGTKIVIYAWLIEKIYVVTSTRKSRWKTLSYRFHVVLMLPYVAIFALMLIFHTAELQDTGLCIIGLQSVAALPLIIYDFFINLYMTIFFVRPLIKLGSKNNSTTTKTDTRKQQQSRLHEVALRTLVASVVCLIVSFANIFSLQMLEGRERGLVCLTCCTVDVTINVITIHWVTSQAPGKRTKDSQLDYSSSPSSSTHHHQRDSNSEHQLQEDIVITPRLQKAYGFTDSGQQAPPYSPNVTTTVKIIEKSDAISNSDSNFCTTSQSSRQSLVKN